MITRTWMAPSGSKQPNINAVTADLQEIELELRPHGSCQYHAMRTTALQVLQPTFGALECTILIQTTYLSHKGPQEYPKGNRESKQRWWWKHHQHTRPTPRATRSIKAKVPCLRRHVFDSPSSIMSQQSGFSQASTLSSGVTSVGFESG